MQSICDPHKPLVMQAVNLYSDFPQNSRQARVLFDHDFMNKSCAHMTGVSMVNCIWKLIRDVCVQGATEAYIDNLNSAANTQKRFSTFNCRSHQRQFHPIPLEINAVDTRVRISTELTRFDISTAGQQ